MRRLLLFASVCLLTVFLTSSLFAAPFKIGTAKTDITPPGVISLWGQFQMRLSQKPQTPLTANVIALESTDQSGKTVNTIFVSADLLQISPILLKAVQKKIVKKEPAIDPNNIVLNGTHTHTAPVLSSTYSSQTPKGVATVEEVVEFISSRVSDAIAAAWKNRQPAKMAFGLDHAGIAMSRRIVYKDGHATMYGKTDTPDFFHIEGVEDQDVNTVFFTDKNDKMLAVIINVSCPSQVVEGLSVINADYWLPVRENMAKRFGPDAVILGWCGAAGDLCPRPLYRKTAFNRMAELRGLNAMQEIARKLDTAVGDTWSAVKKTLSDDCIFGHIVKEISLPMRKVTQEEYVSCKKELDQINAQAKAHPEKTMSEIAFMAYGWYGSVVKRYEEQQKNPDPQWPTVIHVIRFGDIAICTNQFELYTDFGIQMKSWSPAVQTFVVQLTGNGTYLPTQKAVNGGSYSAIIQSNLVGPEGGQKLVDETVLLMKKLWQK